MRTRSLESSTRTLVSASLVALLLLLLAGCGVDNPGEPRGEAEQIAAPNLGDVHVYCVESEHVAITPCSVRLDVRGRHSPVEIRDWWLRASHDLVTAGTVSTDRGDWRFDFVVLSTERSPGGGSWLGWRCRSDRGKSARAVASAMQARNPAKPGGIATLAAARARDCVLAAYPD